MPGKNSSMTTEEALALLAETPERLAALAADLTPEQVRAAPSPGEWSANDVLAHLRACADVWGGAITAILAEDHPTIHAINPQAWIERTWRRPWSPTRVRWSTSNGRRWRRETSRPQPTLSR